MLGKFIWVGIMATFLMSGVSVCGAKGIDFSYPRAYAPSGLVVDGGDGEVFLEWNPNLEDDLAGYNIWRSEGREFKKVNSQLVKVNQFVDKGLRNGRKYRYYITAVLKDGTESKPSNVVEVIPRLIKAPKVEEGSFIIEVPGYEALRVEKGIKVRFENGHSIIFDSRLMRVRDWQTEDGVHLFYPLPYGNPIDITEMDEFGFPQPQPPTPQRPALPPLIDIADWSEAGRAWWIGYEVRGGGIAFHYRIPLSGPSVPQGANWDLWIWAEVKETWFPVERNILGTLYKGLARRIELEIPSYYKWGYSLCLNDGFGVNGSCDGAITYELRWGNPFLLETHWRKDEEAQGIGAPRRTGGFHPTMEALQVLPFLFLHFPQKGTLIIAPRRYYYAITYCLTNYAKQGKDGIWPNFTIDCDVRGKWFSPETFEYLWTSDNSLQPPQKFIDASFFFRRRLASLYGLNPYLTSLDYAWDYWGPPPSEVKGKSETESLEILKKWGREMAERAEKMGADQLGGAHELWFSSPYTVPDEIRLDPTHPVNRAIAEMIESFTKKGVRFGYWIRPEFVKTAYVNILSDHFHTPYYGYTSQLFPPAVPVLEREGLPLIRNHQDWVRVGRGGEHPSNPPYHWTPMSLASGWYKEVIYKDLVMMKYLGCSSVFQDGGFSCLAGVDYRNGEAVAVQPYYWRFYQDVYRLGLDVNGECLIGWGNNNLPTPSPEDMKYLWAYVHSMYRGNREAEPFKWFTPEMRHRSHQLYIGCYMNLDSDLKHALVARFAQEFLRKNGHPDRVFLEGLRWDPEEKMWKWDRVWWEYKDGRRVLYPNYEEVFGR